LVRPPVVKKFSINSEEYGRNLSGCVSNDFAQASNPSAAGQCMTAGNVSTGEFSGGLAGRAGHIIYREPPREQISVTLQLAELSTPPRAWVPMRIGGPRLYVAAHAFRRAACR
jgi:hypothetical protein